jgi:hypothetical protein
MSIYVPCLVHGIATVYLNIEIRLLDLLDLFNLFIQMVKMNCQWQFIVIVVMVPSS